ncbi:hypothetical protein DICPUDRAFT_153222 [Dictyostelium purpureum]|uniref:Uncharacterized protein n=1 Tax=Dictyostelium purpureum TaxID=5786 RepID=F0ZNC7_DICPU|nr:uncharacterized protein DICPUDRAFT_153222 [Dictyostelium purpureum]EGC34558.1 hypothetical protein DICPUDRAFT_153222 [Dictyostelium purpureum]|eukprot:XP_003288934.1 hypothetical protein DICPUDRAFT_153222 [Dictyostelium purpureum]
MRLSFILVLSLLFLSINIIASSRVFTPNQYQSSFVQWMKSHGKAYSHDEFARKYRTFQDNMDYVHQWNSKNSETVLGLNNFADMNNVEYRNTLLGASIEVEPFRTPRTFSRIQLPTSVDWREKGAVHDIKDQGHCGSCYSFSAIGAAESAYYIANGEMLTLSEQNILDCSRSYGNEGCNGGYMLESFQFLLDQGGAVSEASYPYEAKDASCRFDSVKTPIVATFNGTVEIRRGDEGDLQQAIATHGPVAVAIDAGHISFQLYKTGVYYEPYCSSYSLSHAVLAVGYDTDSVTGKDYWIVANSWGLKWGDSGFIKMARNRGNHCGISTMSSYITA